MKKEDFDFKVTRISLFKWNITQFRTVWKKCRYVEFFDYRPCSQ